MIFKKAQRTKQSSTIGSLTSEWVWESDNKEGKKIKDIKNTFLKQTDTSFKIENAQEVSRRKDESAPYESVSRGNFRAGAGRADPAGFHRKTKTIS